MQDGGKSGEIPFVFAEANKLHLVTKTKGTSFVCQNASLNIIGLFPDTPPHLHKPQ